MSNMNAFHIVLQRGIQGGFAPPIPNALYTIDHAANSDVFTITIQTRPHGTPSLQPATTKSLPVADHIHTLTALQTHLRDLPPQYTGAQDLYGLNTSILLLTDASECRPSGAVAGNDVPYPTEAQKAQFGRAVEIIEQWVAA